MSSWRKCYRELLGKEIGAVEVIWGFTLLLVAIILAGIELRIRDDREQLYKEIQANCNNLTRIISEQVSRTLDSVDQSLKFVKFQVESGNRHIDLHAEQASGFLNAYNLNQIGFADEHGRYTYSNLLPHKPMDLSDREHFKVHIDHDSKQVFISKPVIGRATGKWSIQLTRRVNKKNGEFGGMVVASLDPFFLTSLYSELDLGNQGSVAIIGTDGFVRARRSGDKQETGQDSRQTMVMAYLLSGTQSGAFKVSSPFDQIERIYSYRKVPNYPLYIFVGLSEAEATARFLDSSKVYRSFGLALVLIILVLARVATDLYKKQDSLSRQLKESLRLEMRASEMKSNLIAAVSHELRTPLTGVVGYAELLRDAVSNPEHRELAQVILNSGAHLRDIVNTILDISRIEAGKMILEPKSNSIEEVLLHVRDIYKPLADERKLQLRVNIEKSVPEHAVFDRMRLVQVLSNLVHNGLKFTESGFVSMEARMNKGRVELLVRDTGCGISQENIPQIFDRFTQVENFSVRKQSGSGLGLALCKDLVALMGSQLKVESVLGQGSVFSFLLP